VPAAAVIPAPVAYAKVAAVKKLVVGNIRYCSLRTYIFFGKSNHLVAIKSICLYYFEESRVFQAGYRLEYFSME
jgi:hypothetical protein